jgi:NADH-quinone oxidoreductase subunit K
MDWAFTPDSVTGYFIVSGLMFLFGILTILTRRNAIYILLGVELILNAANLNFVAFARFGAYGIDGHIFAVFIIILAASEAAVALAIILQIFNSFGTIDLNETNLMKR